MNPLDLIPVPWNLVAKIVLPILALAGIWFAGDFHGHAAQKHRDDASIASITRDRDTHAANEATLTAALARQNAAVGALKADSDQRAADGQKARREAQRANQTLQDQAAALRKSGQHKVEGPACPVSDTLSKIGSI
jgi:outer membrane murein-binding lipoprotein Lpp